MHHNGCMIAKLAAGAVSLILGYLLALASANAALLLSMKGASAERPLAVRWPWTWMVWIAWALILIGLPFMYLHFARTFPKTGLVRAAQLGCYLLAIVLAWFLFLRLIERL
jgi:hypothetical protein